MKRKARKKKRLPLRRGHKTRNRRKPHNFKAGDVVQIKKDATINLTTKDYSFWGLNSRSIRAIPGELLVFMGNTLCGILCEGLSMTMSVVLTEEEEKDYSLSEEHLYHNMVSGFGNDYAAEHNKAIFNFIFRKYNECEESAYKFLIVGKTSIEGRRAFVIMNSLLIGVVLPSCLDYQKISINNLASAENDKYLTRQLGTIKVDTRLSYILVSSALGTKYPIHLSDLIPIVSTEGFLKPATGNKDRLDKDKIFSYISKLMTRRAPQPSFPSISYALIRDQVSSLCKTSFGSCLRCGTYLPTFVGKLMRKHNIEALGSLGNKDMNIMDGLRCPMCGFRSKAGYIDLRMPEIHRLGKNLVAYSSGRRIEAEEDTLICYMDRLLYISTRLILLIGDEEIEENKKEQTVDSIISNPCYSDVYLEEEDYDADFYS